jgi:diguanylate cyclase (GGDEF)-like protein/PAS domain S-box-containing protein
VETEQTATGHPLVAIARFFAMAIAIALLCWISIQYTREPGGISALWMASGVLTGILLTSARRSWPGYVIATFVANAAVRIAIGDPWHVAVGLSFASLVDAVPVAIALVHWVGDVTDPSRISRSGRVAFASTLLSCAVSALLAVPLIATDRGGSFGWAYAMWFTTHTLGMVIFATFTTVARSLGWRLIGNRERRTEFALTIVLLGTVCFVVFSQSRYPLLFLVYPPLLLCVFRHRLVGALLATALVTASAIAATLSNTGPFRMFADGGLSQRILLMQAFIGSICLVTFPVLTVLTERRHFARRLLESQRRLRAITDNTPAFVMHVDLTGHYTFINAYADRMLGADGDSLVGRSVRELAAEVYEQVKPYAEAALRGEIVSYELERDMGGRHYHWQSTYVPDIDDSGRIGGYYILSFDITRLKQIERELSLIARHDSLTGLPNRRYLDEYFEMAIARQRRSGRPMVVIYLDIDRFKEINDRLGHATGDVVLCEFARRLRQSLYDTDFVIRLGGDEFVVLIENVDTIEFLPWIAEKLQRAFAPAIPTEQGDLFVTSSIGVAFCPISDRSPDEMIRIADGALYEAKTAGRNTWHLVVLDKAEAKNQAAE